MIKIVVIVITAFAAWGCGVLADPYPRIRWHNNSESQVTLRDGRYSKEIPPHATVDQIPGKHVDPFVLVMDEVQRQYPKRLPPRKFATSNALRNTLTFTYQIEPDGRVIAVRPGQTLPVSPQTPQPSGFPLMPEEPPGR